MPIYDIFSKRQKRILGEVPDVFKYDNIPLNLRVQIIHILKDALGNPDIFGSPTLESYEAIHDILCREYGWLSLSPDGIHTRPDYYHSVLNFIMQTGDYEKVLDAVEVSFKLVNAVSGNYVYKNSSDVKIEPEEAINELNSRFIEHGIGYQFESGQIIRIDSKFVHTEIVKPVLNVLSDELYKGANDEFLRAHEHYRKKEYKECLNYCLKAFESTMKIICKKHHWKYDETDTAKKLLEICFQNNLIPQYLQCHYTALRSSLESGVPTIRNIESAHGQGEEIKEIPPYMASYMIHLTASGILLLTDAEKEL